MESKQFIQSAGSRAIQSLGTVKPEKGAPSAENAEVGGGSPMKDPKNVLLEPIQMAEPNLTPIKT